MGQILFNLNDVALILIACNAIILGAIILWVSVEPARRRSNLFLGLFLFSLGIEAMDTLIYWNTPIKTLYLTGSLHLFFLLKFSTLIQGPLLFLYVQQRVSTALPSLSKALTHLIPLLFFPIIITWIYLSLGPKQLQASVWDYDILFNNLGFKTLLIVQNLTALVYAGLALRFLIRFKLKLMENFSNIDRIDYNWLRLLVCGFILLWCWRVTSQLFHGFELQSLADSLGLAGNYIQLIFVNVLVFYSISASKVIHPLFNDNQNSSDKALDSSFEDTDIKKISAAMNQRELFLDPDLTLEQLANCVELSPRHTSNIINRHFQQNFFEFVNYFRVEKAKQLLAAQVSLPQDLHNEDQSKPVSILEVMYAAGFNSKSAFNRFFKKYENLTPSQYREQCLSQKKILKRA